MFLEKKRSSKKFYISMKFSFISIFALSLVWTAVILLMQTSGSEALSQSLAQSNYLPVILNFLPVFLTLVLIYLVFNSLVVSVGVVSFVLAALVLANRIKIVYRHDPLMPLDIMLINEVWGVAAGFSTRLIAGVLGSLLFIILAAIILFIFVKNERIDMRLRGAGVALSLVLMLLANSFLYRSASLNQSLHVVGNVFNRVDQFNSRGFLYSFLFDLNTMRVTRPEGYDRNLVAAHIESLPAGFIPEHRPDVFIIMAEAFSEMSLAEGISFEGFVDPLYHYLQIKAESFYGTMVVPGIGGGTADTEFDVLTGINTRHYRGVPYSNLLITRTTPSLAMVFNYLGYDNLFLHPGHHWFYNRYNVLPFLGFGEFVCLRYFDELTQSRGMYIKDSVAFDFFTQHYLNHIETVGTPYFGFMTTIQNHGPYPDKYLVDTNFNHNLNLEPIDVNALSNYFEGVIDGDIELWRFVEFLRHRERPAVVLYFSDHLPAFRGNIYDQLIPHGEASSLQGITRLYQVPYLVWHNEAAAGMVNFDIGQPGEVISSFYLGSKFLAMLGFQYVDPFFAEGYRLQYLYPVVLEHQFFTPDGQMHLVSDGLPEYLSFYKNWEYFRLFD